MPGRKDELVARLCSADILIGYAPIGDEPSPGSFIADRCTASVGVSVLPHPDINAENEARALAERYAGKSVAVLIPGRVFDTSGTRHGRGGGWYDRFLSVVPKGWLRVGVLTKDRLNADELVRKSWDEPVDALLVWSGSWDMMATEPR